jgi:superfamily I DNA/RNA helicase
VKLTQEQNRIVEYPLDSKIFLSGPPGCGKTTAGVERLRVLLVAGLPADSLLILTPQRTLQIPYEATLAAQEIPPGGQVTLATIGGLARRMVDLFWPMVSEAIGFTHADEPPLFLTLETAQYYMARIVRPLLEEGYFASVTINRNRLYSQVLDNLNKAASVGFAHTEISERLKTAWSGDPGQRRVFEDAQECANRFRQYCLDHNLLDFSLQLEVFWKFIWRMPECREYLTLQYQHVIYDNIEEDIPIAHDLMAEWLPALSSALIIFDKDGGYRRFLGADPITAQGLQQHCNLIEELNESFVCSAEVQALENAFSSILSPGHSVPISSKSLSSLSFPPAETPSRFFPQMLDWAASEIKQLIAEGGIPPSEIVVLTPYLSDALRFSLSNRFDEMEIPWRSQRPSRSLRDEPACQCLLTLAALAHPGWSIHPTKFDLAYAFLYGIEGMDLVRAQLLVEIVYRPRDLTLSSFDLIRPEVQERLTFVFGQRYEALRAWIESYRQQPVTDPLDQFLRRLFGEILSTKGFGFHRNFDGSRLAASLVESVQKFRQAMMPSINMSREISENQSTHMEMGKEYLAMLQEGVIAAQYVEDWQAAQSEAVLIAPAHTFLMTNRPVTVQFWLDAGSRGWWERLFQPLTQPYVLSRSWDRDQAWTDADDQNANQQTLERLIVGLLRRCRDRVYIGLSELGESGYESRGPLLKAIWNLQLESQKINEK